MRKTIFILATLAAGPASAQSYDCVIQPKSIVTVVAADQGAIAEVLVERGDFVEQGQVLARLEDGVQRLQVELTAEQSSSDVEIRAGLARLELRDKELERAQTLADRSVATALTLQEAEAERTLTELAVEQARIAKRIAELSHEQAKVFLDRRTVRAPVDGLIMRVDGQPGEFAHEQFVLMTLAEIDPLKVEAYLPQQEYPNISVGEVYQVRQNPPLDGLFDAEVVTIDRVFDAASGTFGVVLQIENPEGAIQAGTRCQLVLSAQN